MIHRLIHAFRRWHRRRYALHEYSYGVVPYHQPQDGSRRYLLIRQSNLHWDFPKGHREPGEAAIATARRELAEEAGVTAHIQPKLFFQHTRLIVRPIGLIPKTVGYFAGRVEHTVVKIQAAEIIDYRWCDLAEAYDLLTYPRTKQILLDAHKRLDDISG